jgi:23S rRNA pseudouridine1911/1915/1917 synthase
MLEIGDQVEVAYEAADYVPLPPADTFQEMEVLFEDPYIAVVNKPPALLTVPTPYRERTTLISLLEKWMQRNGTGQEAFCVHRLDRGVSGVLVFGKKLEIAEALRTQFEKRKPERHYVAIVGGHVEEKQGTFETHLTTDKHLHRHSTDDPEEGELAITHYEVLHYIPNATVVSVQLETGRRNQIRVHFAEAGHPVLGDNRYGNPQYRLIWQHRRLALHAESLAFQHPVTRERLHYQVPLPAEMQAMLRAAQISPKKETRTPPPAPAQEHRGQQGKRENRRDRE